MAKRKTRKTISLEQLNGEIQIRAYQISKERNFNEGDELSDWLHAEKEIKKKYKINS